MNCMTNTNRQMKKAPTKSCRNLPKIKVSSRLSLYMIDMHSKCEAKIQFSFHSQAVCGGESRRRRTVCEKHHSFCLQKGGNQAQKTPSACKNCPTSARRRTKKSYFCSKPSRRCIILIHSPSFFAYAQPSAAHFRPSSHPHCGRFGHRVVQASQTAPRVGLHRGRFSGRAPHAPTCPRSKIRVPSRRGAASASSS